MMISKNKVEKNKLRKICLYKFKDQNNGYFLIYKNIQELLNMFLFVICIIYYCFSLDVIPL